MRVLRSDNFARQRRVGRRACGQRRASEHGTAVPIPHLARSALNDSPKFLPNKNRTIRVLGPASANYTPCVVPQPYEFAAGKKGHILCRMCNIVTTDATQLLIHQRQPAHKRLMGNLQGYLQAKIPTIFYCEVGKTSLSASRSWTTAMQYQNKCPLSAVRLASGSEQSIGVRKPPEHCPTYGMFENETETHASPFVAKRYYSYGTFQGLLWI